MRRLRQKHFHVLDHVYREPEATDCDKLSLVLIVPMPRQSGGVREELLHFPDRMGLAQWTQEGSLLQINQTSAGATQREKESGEGVRVFEG